MQQPFRARGHLPRCGLAVAPICMLWLAAAAVSIPAQAADDQAANTIKQDAKTAGHAVSEGAKSAGHTVSEDAKKVGKDTKAAVSHD